MIFKSTIYYIRDWSRPLQEKDTSIENEFTHKMQATHQATWPEYILFQIHVSYVEIYNEEIRDLLSHDNRKLEIKGNHGAVAGCGLRLSSWWLKELTTADCLSHSLDGPVYMHQQI